MVDVSSAAFVAWAKARGFGGDLRQFLARRVVAVEHRGQRPGRDVLVEAYEQAAENGRQREARLEPRVRDAEDRAIVHMECEADGCQ
jgi:hypothetical protein